MSQGLKWRGEAHYLVPYSCLSIDEGPPMRRVYENVHIVMISSLLFAAVAVDTGVRHSADHCIPPKASLALTLPER